MNSLSWFLYFADFVGKIGGLTGILAFLTVVLIFILPPKGIKFLGNGHEHPFMGFSSVKPLVIITSILIAVSVILPSKETLYLIAGSEAGEYVVTSPDGQEIVDNVKEVIKLQIEQLKPSESK